MQEKARIMNTKDITPLFNERFGTSFTEEQIRGFCSREKLFGYRRVGRQLGSECVTEDGSVKVKVEMPDVWRRKHHIIWESLYGPIPQGYVVTFRDGNKTNLSPENLVLVTALSLFYANRQGTVMPVGAESLNKDGFVIVKVGPKCWKLKHYIVWESIHGPIPAGHNVLFADGNKHNFDPENLILVSYSERGKLVAMLSERVDADLTRTALQIIRVRQAVKSRRKNRTDGRGIAEGPKATP